MNFAIYHQIGYQEKWNLESYYRDHSADGLIISPSFTERATIEGYANSLKSKCIFDPQFFLPSVAKRHLATYDFFPGNVVDGFVTTVFQEGPAISTAEKCVDWQIKNQFCYIVIPNRYEAGMPTDYISKQRGLYVDPFLAILRDRQPQQKVLLQLVLNDHMLLDEAFTTDILNWVTGLSEIHGVYLIFEVEKRTKQLKNIDLLVALLKFVDTLSVNDMEVVVGFTNTEAILLSIANPAGLTIGSYENTRMFNIRNFENQSEKKALQGPNARLYFSKLLQWVDNNYLGAINRNVPEHSLLVDPTKYRAEMFETTFRWHFTKPELYMHYFVVFSKQLREVAKLEGKERWENVRSNIRSAMDWHQKMEENGVIMDQDSNGSHLGPWLTAANEFGKFKGWL